MYLGYEHACNINLRLFLIRLVCGIFYIYWHRKLAVVCRCFLNSVVSMSSDGKKIQLSQSLIIHHAANVFRCGIVITRTFTLDTRWRKVVFLHSLYLRHPLDRRQDPTDILHATGKNEVPRTCQEWRPLAPVVQPEAQSTSWTWGAGNKTLHAERGEQLFVGAIYEGKKRSPIWRPSTPFRPSVHDLYQRTKLLVGPGWLSRYSNSLRALRFGVRT
jgi:hypothetical protein